MTHPRPDWDITALGNPTVVHIPDAATRPAPEAQQERPLIALAGQALNRQLSAGASDCQPQLRALAVAGVVAVRTSREIYELRETLSGWRLVRTWGEPEPAELAAAAWIRAHRLAHERRDAPPTSGPAPGGGRPA
ncbi:hypothetical protein [Parafrankia sp. EUN1f]|uniref:hypothetical protein n=1 Tax=Parafrankia sp. EUN1f TaxID=102897 RepID=UPI0001C4520E|nr:hypothetical protein [Parafrankia sp. EUN1f]EFC82857.1 hypothetical protein FrEUN1fDRAFT_4054 [Parafrankia sp. EUN1f]